jgi:HK97 family phage major capsid protein
MKEESVSELKAERDQLIKRGKELIEAAKKETRALNEAESREYNEIQLDIRRIDLEIVERNYENRAAGKPHAPAKGESFSLRRAILAHVTNQTQRDCEARAIAEAMGIHSRISDSSQTGGLIIPFETRAAYTAVAEAATGVVVEEEQLELLLPLESNLVLSQAGVRMLTGLKGNISWPNHSGVKVFWEGENTSAKDGAGKFTKGSIFAPKRLTAYVDLSKQLLVQENRSVEGLIRQLFAIAIAQKIEQTAFGTAAHTDNVPDGLFQDEPTITGNFDWPTVVAMETGADLNNALFGNLAYIMHPSLVGKAKTKVKDTSGAGGFIFGEKGEGLLNGYKALRTNNIPADIGSVPAAGDNPAVPGAPGMIFANWADYFLGQWGAIDILVDPYTQSTEGMVRLVVNSYWNMGKVRGESFVTAALK